ncbi:hypothetical protein EDD86DRAFT_248809 [Gorgonomyces haynaldii]|nr:hypothetical protein EDD86DRAFT_248809 [Gorgonomyces haynaldii]
MFKRLVTRSLTTIRTLNLQQLHETAFFSQHRPLALEVLPPQDKLIKGNPLDDLFSKFEQMSVAPVECISILKRRRKKMNKHKWKKHRKALRGSTRYNKEKNKKRGIVREKQE